MIDALFVCALLASGTTANKFILQSMPATFFVGLRMFLGGILLLAGIFRRSSRLRLNYLKQDWLKLILISCSTTFLPSIFKAYALQHMPLQKAALLASFDPFVSALYSFLLFGEQLGIQKFIGMMVGFTGIAISLLSSSPDEALLSAWGFISWPELAAIAAVFISRYGWILVADVIKKDRYDTYEINSIMMIIGGLLSFATCWYMSCFSFSYFQMEWQKWAAVAYTVIIGNVFAYTLWSRLFKKYTINFMSLVGFSISIFSSIYGYLLFHEPLTLNFALAATVTFTGLLIFYHKESQAITR